MNTIYRHFKGGMYKYICDATIESNPDGPMSNVIVYESVKDRRCWVRPRVDFFGTVEVNGEHVKRFEKQVPQPAHAGDRAGSCACKTNFADKHEPCEQHRLK